jgi:hypothetical protein
VLKKAKYWRAFTADTRAQAEKAAADWWDAQSGFDRISGWVLPAGDAPSGATPQWTATIIYRDAVDSDSGAQPPRPALH